jgi:hypothetical protein
MKMEDKVQLLLDGAKGLRSLADALEIAADLLRVHGMDDLPVNKVIQPYLFEVQGEAPFKETKEDEAPLSLIDVRRVLAEKSREGHTDQVRLLLQKYGADKLSAIDPSCYRNLADEAECLGATLEDLQAAVEEKTGKGLADLLPDLFDHHYATSLEDLKPSYYPGFLRDLRRLGNE